MYRIDKIKDKIEYGGCLVGQEEEDAILKVIRNQGRRRWTLGEESVQFEKELAEKTGVDHAVVVNSGSSALLLAISALKLPKDSKVIIPALNFPTAYSSLLQNGLKPVVVDCDINTLNLDLEKVQQAINIFPDIKAVIAVHIAGNIVDLKKLREIVRDRIIISDNCDGYGGKLDNKYIDTYADVSCISMHAAHIICMGEGGAVLTSDKEIADRARKMREWGRESGSDKITQLEGFPDDYRERYVFTEIGYNMKPLELQCAMGRVQLRRLKGFVKKRRENYYKLKEIFDKDERFKVITSNVKGENSCWFGFPFLCSGIERKKVMDFFEEMNIEVRTIFSGNILRHPAYQKTGIQSGMLANSDRVMREGMFIGNHPSMTDEQFNYIEKVLKELK